MFSKDYVGKVILVPDVLEREGRDYYIWTRKGPSRARITNIRKIPDEKLNEKREGVFYGKLKLSSNFRSSYLNFEVELYGLIYLE